MMDYGPDTIKYDLKDSSRTVSHIFFIRVFSYASLICLSICLFYSIIYLFNHRLIHHAI